MKPLNSNPTSKAELTGPRYWRSLDDLAQSPQFLEQVEREFGPEASELSEVDRRHFFKIMAASFALGGLGFSGCRRPESHILPHSKAPEHLIPGEPLYYASSYSLRGESLPLLVETHTGRPTKIEGNGDFEGYNGGTSLKAQASVLDLYDPDRATHHKQDGSSISQSEVFDLLKKLKDGLSGNNGDRFAILTEKSSSPTRQRLKNAFQKAYPKAIWAEYEPVETDGGAKAAKLLAGPNLKPLYDFSQAERILSVDGDFLGQDPGALKFSKQFADGRRVRTSKDEMNRLYIAESNMTITGAMADHRKRLASSQMAGFLAGIALNIELGVEGDALKPIFENLSSSLLADEKTKAWIEKCADDLAHHKGKSLVYVGAQLSPEAHAIGLLINEKLGNLGETLTFVEDDSGDAVSLGELADAISGNGVETLVILGGNPVYNAPVDLDFSGLLDKVDSVVRLGYYEDETSYKAGYHILQAHYLETWGDGRTYDGAVLPQQPMILPLFDGLSEIEVLARLLGETNADGHSLVYETFQKSAASNGKRAFDKFLHDGFVSKDGYKKRHSLVSGSKLANTLEGFSQPEAPTAESLEVVFVNDAKVDDGRYNNNGWLQECPDPINKLTWDNGIIVSPRLAKELGIVAPDATIQVARKNPNRVRDGRTFAPVYKLKVGDLEVEGAVHILPGLDNYSIVLPLGYGRSKTGRVGQNSGYDAYSVRTSSSMAFATGATLEATGREFQLTNTQEHWSMEGRAIIREANLDYYSKSPDWVSHMGMESHSPPIYGKDKYMPTQEKVTTTPRGESLYEHPDHTGNHQWGMNIDLNVCTGCNACVVACQAENNIPIVGRDQVRRGREMHWIRLDRYFSSGLGKTEIPEDPQVMVQPVGCMHCETAPCEQVCPVNATVHDSEGLNTMAYNRCIGTRYCANNCPYKVRRFNFFDYQQRPLDRLYEGPLAPKGKPELLQMAQNPDVSVRMRGVMEKCTYCTQRIQQAKIDQKVEARDSDNVKVPDGTIKTACEQVCPTNAIVFGDLTDPDSRVSQLRDNELNYSVLGYLNARPRTTYLAKLRNPNPEMPDYADQPLSKLEYKQAKPKMDYGKGHGDSHDKHNGHDQDAHHDSARDEGGSH